MASRILADARRLGNGKMTKRQLWRANTLESDVRNIGGWAATFGLASTLGPDGRPTFLLYELLYDLRRLVAVNASAYDDHFSIRHFSLLDIAQLSGGLVFSWLGPPIIYPS
jgi:hypothetical protein